MANDPVVWIIFVPAVACLLYEGWKRRQFGWVYVGVTFASLYLFFVLASRPILVYSALVIVPFGCLALGYAVDRLPKRLRWASLAFFILWGLYLYPLAAGIAVPLQPYQWLLQRVTTVGLGS